MLPFIKKAKQQTANPGLAVSQIDRPSDNQENSNDSNDFLEVCGEQLIHAIKMNDAKAAIFALRVIHDKFHEEMNSDETESNTFQSQNIKAGQE